MTRWQVFNVASMASISGFVAASALAQLGATVPNWTVPSYRAGMTTMGDATSPIPFIGVMPCRIVDTRGPTGPFGGPSLAGGATRNFDLPGGPCAGIPATVAAYSLNITVTNTLGPGFIKIWPEGGTQPLVSTLNYLAGQTVANAAIVSAGTAGAISVKAGVSGTDLIIDINGYYATSPNTAGNFFLVSNDSTVAAIEGDNASTSLGVIGVLGKILSFSPGIGSAGVAGINNSTSGAGSGVFGIHNGIGVGVLGESKYGYGVYGNSNSLPGVYGKNFGTSGISNGVYGTELSTVPDSAGVEGVDSSGLPAPLGSTAFTPAGVRGESTTGVGALGVSRFQGTVGTLVDSTGTLVAAGLLGCSATGCGTAGNWGVYAFGNVGASGAKPFVEVHPTDPDKVIRYVALEGPEAGTYFRGRARFSNGLATIAVPESFRLVTDEEGLTVQITPIGEPVSFAVVKVGLDEIVVRASKDTEFFYLVNGVRQTFKDWKVMVDGGYMPESPAQTIPAYFSDAQKRRLIANGTYNPDGTVNMETAERVGWTRIWAERKATAEAAAKENAAKGFDRSVRNP